MESKTNHRMISLITEHLSSLWQCRNISYNILCSQSFGSDCPRSRWTAVGRNLSSPNSLTEGKHLDCLVWEEEIDLGHSQKCSGITHGNAWGIICGARNWTGDSYKQGKYLNPWTISLTLNYFLPYVQHRVFSRSYSSHITRSLSLRQMSCHIPPPAESENGHSATFIGPLVGSGWLVSWDHQQRTYENRIWLDFAFIITWVFLVAPRVWERRFHIHHSLGYLLLISSWALLF